MNAAPSMHPDRKSGALDRFLREIRAAAALSHDNVVKAYSALQFGELLVFAMEYVDGEDLAKVVKTRRQEPPRMERSHNGSLRPVLPVIA
jgi:serine/threonine protein kinase